MIDKNIHIVPSKADFDTWLESTAKAINDAATVDMVELDKVVRCREMYYRGVYSDSYDYLYGTVKKKITDDCGNTKEVELKPPAEVRHIPIVKPAIRRLISEEKDRALPYRAIAIDEKNVSKKYDQYIEQLNLKEYNKMLKKMQLVTAIQQANAVQQEMMQQAGPEVMQDPAYQEMSQMLAVAQQVLEQTRLYEEEDIFELTKYFKYKHRDISELHAERVAQFHISDQRLRELFNRGIQERLVTGHEIYFVDWEPGMMDPVYELLHYEQIMVPYNEQVNYLHEHSWCVVRRYMSIDNLLSYYSQYIDGRDVTIEELKSVVETNGSISNLAPSYVTPEGMVIPGFVTRQQSPQYNTLTGDQIPVDSIYWKSATRIPVLFSKNKYGEDRPDFVKFISEEEAEKLLERPEKLKAKGQRIEYRYRQDLYRVIKVGNKILVKGKHPVRMTSDSKMSEVQLPIIGHSQHYYYQDESLVWETKDIQELYNILHYQKELLIVLAGVKGIVMDLSQKPDGMTMQEVIYYMRQGIAPIQTVDKSGRVRNGSFNQFAQYDQTISPSIQVIDNTLMMLKALVGEITGVTDIRRGVIKPTDQVGTAEISYHQSALVTEMFFQKHFDLIEQVLTRGVNLSTIAYRDGRKAEYISSDKTVQRLNLKKEGWTGEFRMRMSVSRKDMDTMAQIQQMALQSYGRGIISGSNLLAIMDTSSVIEARVLLEKYEDLAMKMEQAQRDNQMQQMAALEQQKAQLQLQLQQMALQSKQAIEQMKAELENKRIQVMAQNALIEKESFVQSAQVDALARKYSDETERAVESAYLQYQYDKLDIDTALRKLEIMTRIGKSKTLSGYASSTNKEHIKN